MCRFLLLRSDQETQVQTIFEQFAKMAEASRAPDGDRQEDGWGVTWLENGNWKGHHSLAPIWDDVDFARQIPHTKHLLVHARSASFVQHKGILEYNQPYIHGSMAFVFNGMIGGVKLNRSVPGKIGAQKLFNLFLEIVDQQEKPNPQAALEQLYRLIKDNSKNIRGMNIGISDGKNIYAISDYSITPDYFTLSQSNHKNFKMICSERIGEFGWDKVEKEVVKKF